MDNIVKKKRFANFEALRLVAMFMVIILHYQNYAGVLLKIEDPELTPVKIYTTIVETLCIPCLNVWVLITGYFLSTARPSVKRIIGVVFQVWFYTVGITIAMYLTGSYELQASESTYKLIQYLFPLQSEHYWFATAYILMVLFSPIMNAAIEHLNRKQLKLTITGLLIWFSFIRSAMPVNFVTDSYGYAFDWFLCLYIIAGYIRKYEVKLFARKKSAFFVYVGSVAFMVLLKLITYILCHKGYSLNFYFTMPDHHNYVFLLAASLGLFSLFRYIEIKNKYVEKFCIFAAPLTFGVYLLHEHLEIKTRWVGWMESLIGKINYESIPALFAHTIASVIIVFITGVVVDWIRKTIFDFVNRITKGTFISNKIDEIDSILQGNE